MIIITIMFYCVVVYENSPDEFRMKCIYKDREKTDLSI